MEEKEFDKVTFYFKVSCSVLIETNKGKIKKTTENYLIKAATPGEAEKIIAKELSDVDYRIKSLSVTNFLKVL